MKCINFRSGQAKLSVLFILIFSMIFLCQCHHGYVAIGSEPGYSSYPYEGDKEERKYYEEQEREARKHYEEQEREAQKERYEKHKRYEYRYYPSTHVYYDVNRKVYFYLEGDKWQISGTLPGGIRLGFQDYVTIQMDNDRPYMEHSVSCNP